MKRRHIMHCSHLTLANHCETCVCPTASQSCNDQRRRRRRKRRDHSRWTKRKQSKKMLVKANTSSVNKSNSFINCSTTCNDKSEKMSDSFDRVNNRCNRIESAKSEAEHESLTADKTNSVLVYDSEDESDSDSQHLVNCEDEHTRKESKSKRDCCLRELHKIAHHILHFVEQEEHEEETTCYNKTKQQTNSVPTDCNCRQCEVMRTYLMQIGGTYRSLAAGKEFCVWLKPPEYNFDLVHVLRNELLCKKLQMHSTNNSLECVQEVTRSDNGVKVLECALHRFIAAHHDTIQHMQNSMLITLFESSTPSNEEKKVDDLNTSESHMDSQTSAAHIFADSQAEHNNCREGIEQITITPNPKAPKAMHGHYELSPGEKAALSLLSMNDIFTEESTDGHYDNQTSEPYECETITESICNEESDTINEFSAAAIYSCDADKKNNMNSSSNNNYFSDVCSKNVNRLRKSASLSGNLIAKQLRQSQQKWMQREKQLFMSEL